MATQTTDNSFSNVIANFIRLQNNSVEILQKMSQATTTSADTIAITLQNSSGTATNYTIPSFGYLKSSIDRIDNTISTMLGFDGSDAYIRMPDGTFKKIYQSTVPTDPSPVGPVTVPAKFIAENNWFFESMMSPAMKVSIDVTNYVPQQESKIFVKRMILNINDQSKLDYFNNNVNGKNDIDYISFLVELQKRNIDYFLDESVVDLPLSVVRYTGEFLVVNYEDRTITNPDGTSSTKRYYLLDKLTYNDNLSIAVNSMTLKLGDRLIKGNSIYEVAEIDISTRYVRVTRTSGYDPFVIGEFVNFYSDVFSPKYVNVGIGYDEREVIFFKSVNDEENLIGTKYSPGVAFFTNDLSIDLTNGSKSLADFYRDNVLDFGATMLASAKEQKIAAVDGVTPDAPVLDAANFKVVSVNDHKLNQKDITAIRQKQTTKVTLESQINELQTSIDKLTTTLSTKKYSSTTEKNADKNQLENLIRERNSKSSLYSSIVKELAAIADNKPAALDTPKYRVRGFFALPAPKTSPSGLQYPIQFLTYYRYVSTDGNTNDVVQFDFTDANGATKRGSFSNLVEVKSDIRKKKYDTATGKYVWANEDVANPDVVNINQIDIPISKGEKVEFYVKTVSEAGWPDNPLISSSSNVVTIEFPSDLTAEDEAVIALQKAQQEAVKVDLENELAAKGLDVHLSSSFTAGEKYYAHSAEVISSSFFDGSGNVLSLFDKLNTMSLQIQELQSQLAKERGMLSVSVLDTDSNTETPVPNGNVVTLFAGYYQDYQALLPSSFQRGAIINKQYKLLLKNTQVTPLQLVARIYGGIALDLPSTTTSTTYADADYVLYRKYDQVPLNNLSIGPNDTNNSNKISSAMYQSGQLRSQYMYARYKDIGLVNDLYLSLTGTSDTRYYEPFFGLGIEPTASWVWNGQAIPAGGTAQGNGYLTKFCIHTDNPILDRTSSSAVTAFAANLQTPSISVDSASGFPTSPEVTSAFRHAYGFDEAGSVTQPAKQLNYRNNWSLVTTSLVGQTSYQPLIQELPDKIGFNDSDRYLVGYQTVGAYFAPTPVTFNQMMVDGIDARAVKVINFGEGAEIAIPLTFQFRMEDYYGSPGGAGRGIVGGYNPDVASPPTNLTYARRLGFDIYEKETGYELNTYSFDIIVYATYKKESLAQVISAATPDLDKNIQDITYTKETVKTTNT